MIWDFRFEAPVGLRTMRNFSGVTAHGLDIWWHHDLKTWGPYDLSDGPKSSHHHGKGSPKTVKAFKRYMKKHGGSLKGHEVILLNREYIKLRWGGSCRLDVVAKEVVK